MKTPALIALVGVITMTVNLYVENSHLKSVIHLVAGGTAWWFYSKKHTIKHLALCVLFGPLACLFVCVDDILNSELDDAKAHEF